MLFTQKIIFRLQMIYRCVHKIYIQYVLPYKSYLADFPPIYNGVSDF